MDTGGSQTPRSLTHRASVFFISDNSCNAYAFLLSMGYDSSFGGMVCHFPSSVHRSVITEAKARLFYSAPYKVEGVAAAVFTLFSIFLPHFSTKRLTSFFCFLSLIFSSTQTQTHSSHFFPQNGRKPVMVEKRTAGITINFKPHLYLADRMCRCQRDWNDNLLLMA